MTSINDAVIFDINRPLPGSTQQNSLNPPPQCYILPPYIEHYLQFPLIFIHIFFYQYYDRENYPGTNFR